jgi:hypothetical protein
VRAAPTRTRSPVSARGDRRNDAVSVPSPTAQTAPAFPMAPAPSAAAAAAAGKTRSKKDRFLSRGTGNATRSKSASSAASGADSTSESDSKTISIVSTRTPVSPMAGGNARGGPFAAAASRAANNRAAAAGGSDEDDGDDAEPTSSATLSARAQRKLKMIDKKYGDQDVADREAAMRLNGNPMTKRQLALAEANRTNAAQDAGGNTPPADELPEFGDDLNLDAADGEDDEVARPMSAGRKEVKFAGKEAADGEVGEGADAADADSEAMLAGHDAMRQRQASFEDDVLRMADRIQAEMVNDVPYFDGRPGPNAELSFATVVCAPYAAIRKYALKVKITPGSDKKGAAAKSITAAFATASASSSPQAAAVATIVQDEVIAQLPGLVKVHASELLAAARPEAQSSRAKAKTSRASAAQAKEDDVRERMREQRRLKQLAAAAIDGAAGGVAIHQDPAAVMAK